MYFGSISNMAASGTLLFQRGGVREMTETKHKFDSSWTSILFFLVTFNILQKVQNCTCYRESDIDKNVF